MTCSTLATGGWCFVLQSAYKFRSDHLGASRVADRDVRMVQGRKPGGLPITLYFDDDTGLLTRLVRHSDSPVGRVPTQIDYDDYRDVAGIKMPFKWTSTWTDGRTVFELSAVQPNVRIDAARFAKPTPPVQAVR